MKALLIKLVRTMAGWPLVGRIVRIAVAVIRLPQHQDRQNQFAAEQLPALLSTMSELNARVLDVVQDPENLAQSLPVTLRTLTRELAELRARLDRLEASQKQ
jgi:hypothetical protein